MAIVVDIWARLNQPSVEQAAYRLAGEFDEAGRMAGDRFGSQFERGLAGRDARIQAAFNRIADNTSRVAALQREYNEAVNGGGTSSARAVAAGEKLASARRAEADATGRVAIMQRQYNEAVKESGKNSDQALNRAEQLASARRREGEAISKVQALYREYDEAVNGGGANSSRALALSERLNSARRKEADSHRSAATAIRLSADSLNSVKSASEVAVESLANVGRKAGQAVRGVGVLGSLPVAQLLLDTAQAATTASQSVLLLPAALTAAAAGYGTLQLATSGFSDAIEDIRKPEEFAADLALLGPSAQQAALALQSLLPEFDNLRTAASDPFFSGLGKEFLELAKKFGPGLENMVATISQSFNQAFRGIFDIFKSDVGAGQIENIMANIGQTFKNLVPGAEAFANAILTLTSSGSNFLPEFATSISNLAQDFSNFITTAANNGDLQRWMREGIDAAKLLGEAIWVVGKGLFELFGSDAQGNIAAFKSDVEALSEVMGVLNGDFGTFNDQANGMHLTFGADIREELDMLDGPSAKIRDFFANLPHYADVAVNGIINFANMAKDALINGPVKFVNLLLEGFTKLANVIPGINIDPGTLKIPEAPNIPQIDVTPFKPWQTQQQWQNDNIPEMKGIPERKDRNPFVQDRDKLFDTPENPINPKTGKPYTDKEAKDAKIAALDPSLYKVDPYAPVPGLPGGGELGKTYAGIPGAGPLPGMPGAPGLTTVDQQEVLEKDHRVKSVAHDLEEARKARLVLEQDNNASQHDIDEARWKEVELGWSLQKAQADLVEKQRGTTKKMKQGMDELGAALDPDFGLGDGLAGFAKNLTMFVGNLLAAPALTQLNAISQMNPIQGGYGLMGILGAQNIAQGNSPLLGRPMNSGGLGGLASSYTGSQVAPGMAGVPGVGTGVPGTSTPSARTAVNAAGGINLSTIPVAAQKYANDCIDASARIILSHSGINKSEEELMGIIAPGGSIESQAAGLNQLNPQGQYKAIQGSGGSPEALFAAVKDSIDRGIGSILNVAPGSSLGGNYTEPGHFVAATGYNPDGTINVSDTAKGTSYTVTAQDAYLGTRGRGIVAGTGTGPSPVAAAGPSSAPMSYGTPPGAGAEAWRNTVASTVAKYGPGAGIRPENMQAWTDAIVKQIDTESKGDPNVRNDHDSNGRGGEQRVAGLLQYLDTTYSNTGGKATGLPMMDPVGQIAGALYAPRTADGRPDTAAPGGIGAGHGWAPNSTPGQYAPSAGSPPLDINRPPPAPPARPPVYGPPLPPARVGRGGPVKRAPALTLGDGGSGGGSDLADLLGAPSANPPMPGPMPSGPSLPYLGMPDPVMGMPGAPNALSPAPGMVGPFPTPANVAAAAPPLPMPGAPPPMPTAPYSPPGATGGQEQTRIGGVTPGVALGGSGGVGITPGGSVDTAISMAASAADLFAPGAGQAAQVGIKLGGRAIQYAGQLAAIGVNGLMETFLPTGGSELANGGWIPRIAGGLAGAKPALPNVAGGQTGGNDPSGQGMPGQGAPPLTPEQAAMAGGGNDKPGVQITNNIESNNIGAPEDRQGADIARHVSAGYQGAKV